MFDRLSDLVSEHAELEHALADPAVHSDQEKARTLGRRYAELTPIVHAYREWQQTSADEEAARELAREDSSFADEADQFARHREELEAQLQKLLVPRDPNDGRDVILEVKAGEGGEESALFAGDLLRMYQRYAERRGWKTEILDSTVTGLGGVKDATVVVKGKGGDGAWSRLKYEGGVHRVQRVPVTESQGRIHTSAAGVLVAPEAEPVEVQINDNDLKVDVFRSSGPGGQSVNTTDSAVRVTHLPTGLVVQCQDEKSQHKNKARALTILRSRLLEAELARQADERASERRSQVGSGERSEKIRTYNYPQSRVTDHRAGVTVHRLEAIVEGDLDGLLDAVALEMAARAESEALRAAGPEARP